MYKKEYINALILSVLCASHFPSCSPESRSKTIQEALAKHTAEKEKVESNFKKALGASTVVLCTPPLFERLLNTNYVYDLLHQSDGKLKKLSGDVTVQGTIAGTIVVAELALATYALVKIYQCVKYLLVPGHPHPLKDKARTCEQK